MHPRLSVDEYTKGILAGDRNTLSRAITLTESRLQEDKILAAAILQNVLPYTGNALRIGITGVPGVGKSTFIEVLGKHITSLGKRVAVLAIDPSSKKSGGSILGDKTRMEKLAHDPMAFIRPSATGLSLGGVARSTRESMLLCEAAGYEVILIETVGVGQSETLVKGMTDFFLLLMLAGAGDELQGMKKGITEMADMIAINKCDGDNKAAAQKAMAAFRNALHLFPKPESGFSNPVVCCSASEESGIAEIWEHVQRFHEITSENDFFIKNRQLQSLEWMQDSVRQMLEENFYDHPDIKRKLTAVRKAVTKGELLPVAAAQQLINLFVKRTI
ncbi:methylmalonyl Co-A mutase-associated GTPase MeaB [Dyadobacter sediminis]|uniref:Methylmalonyl Co-A mutase-associated GTPase MeaB n=1 Tax=Dyadobacter sediminis TaxID=1493691 RepID=A0A5R9K5X5_9BACT|nr:methylmalonyl Co-A mutase-associated GTPase MeaB [Dyadobacter sediminis]TLU89053.1 methylmalonyl Co-A mutase-associated GTPase MeaB [Dyadobacter sediminis]GGC03187.1 ATPase/protein kinase [Dyadobacter sediminis]